MSNMETEHNMDMNDPKIKKDADDLSQSWGVDPTNAGRVQGRITGIHPPKKIGDEVKGGYIWIQGDDGVAYFGHITQIEPGVDIFDLRIGQKCKFVPGKRMQGPTAETIEF